MIDENKLQKVILPYANTYIYQQYKGNTITNDTEFLTNTLLELTSNCKNDTLELLELGSGNGIVSIMIKLERPMWLVTGLEVQVPLWSLAKLNKGLTNSKIDFILADLRHSITVLKQKRFDIVISNPPFYKVGRGRIGHNVSKIVSRWEHLCNHEDVIKAVKNTLKHEGNGYLLYPYERSDEIGETLENNNLEVIEIIDDFKGKFLDNTRKKNGSAKVVFRIKHEQKL